MDILLSTDSKYLLPTGVLILSICINNLDQQIRFHILVNKGFTKEDSNALELIAYEYHNHCYFYTVDQDIIHNLPFGKSYMPIHVSIETYYRLFITELLPKDVHKIIYLDGDMICRKSIKELWERDIKGKALGAVHDMNEIEHLGDSRLSYPQSDGYFNAGMLLINVDYWREHDALDTFHRIIRDKGDSIVFHDQDILNMAFHDLKIWLPLTYNFQNGFLFPECDRRCVPNVADEIETTMYDPVIIHYSTGVKPWNVCCTHPQRWVWRYYKSLSPWRCKRLDVPRATSIRQFIKNWAFMLGLQERNTTLYRKVILKR